MAASPGDQMDAPARKGNGYRGYAWSKAEIQIVDGNNLVLLNGAKMRVSGDGQRGANVLCDPAKHGGWDEATTFAIASDSLTLSNYGNAACWLYLSAAQGHHEAQFELALALHFGKGVQKDDGLSFRWMKQAAEQSNNRAQQYLSKYYELGIGVPVDAAQARAWMARANRHEEEPELPQTDQQILAAGIRAFEQRICTPTPGLFNDRYDWYRSQGMDETKAKERAHSDVDAELNLCAAMHAYQPPPPPRH
jgi:TPR repeat protein